jgi:hypothetical protein
MSNKRLSTASVISCLIRKPWGQSSEGGCTSFLTVDESFKSEKIPIANPTFERALQSNMKEFPNTKEAKTEPIEVAKDDVGQAS